MTTRWRSRADWMSKATIVEVVPVDVEVVVAVVDDVFVLLIVEVP